MGANDATLKYTGEYDASQIVAALEAVDREFLEVGKTAEKVFQGISNAEATTLQIAKTNNAMREAMRQENAAKAIKQAEKDAEAAGRVQARAEQEYQRVNDQANIAAARAGAARTDRAIEQANAYHQKRLKDLAGNDAALEAEARRHASVMVTLQNDVEMKAANGARTMIQRVGAIGNQAQALQMAFFGIGSAVDGTDSKFGKMIGTTAMLASGALGMAQAYEVATTSMAGLGATMAVALPVLAAVGVAFALILNHQKALGELAKKNDWLGDPGKFAQVTQAMQDYEASAAAVNKSARENTVAFGSYAGMLSLNSAAMKDATEANQKLQEVTGLTGEKLKALYGDLAKVQEAWEAVNGARTLDLQMNLQRAQIAQQKDGVEKSLAMQEISNRQAEANIKQHFSAIISDVKKTHAERVKAEKDMGAELAIQEQINQAQLAAVRASFANKAEKKDDGKAEAMIKAYHTMNLDAAAKADQAMAKLEDDKFSRTIAGLDAELDAVYVVYREKLDAAGNSARAIFEINQWLANEQIRLAYEAAGAARDQNLVALKDYQDYAGALAKVDAQIRQVKFQAMNDTAGAARQQIADEQAAQDAAVEAQRLKWIQNGTDRVTADKRAQELIEHNHALSASKIDAINKAAITRETQMRQAGYASVLAASEGLVNAIGTQNKALFVISKALAAAQVTVQGFMAIGQVHATTPPIAWPELDGYAIASTALQLAGIAATTVKGFRGGGYTGDGPEDEAAGIVHRKEVVWSAGDVSRAGGRQAVESMRQGGGGGDVYNLGSHQIIIQGRITPEEAREVGANIAQGEHARLRQLMRDQKRAKELGITG